MLANKYALEVRVEGTPFVTFLERGALDRWMLKTTIEWAFISVHRVRRGD